jgi:hypothetical protein
MKMRDSCRSFRVVPDDKLRDKSQTLPRADHVASIHTTKSVVGSVVWFCTVLLKLAAIARLA